MNFIIKLMISTLAVLITALLLPGVAVENNSFFIAFVVAAVLALLNSVVKPVLVLLTIPITLFSLGLFLIVINAFIILMADKLVEGFHVNGFWSALFFSIIVSLVTSVFEGIKKSDDNKNNRNQEEE